MIELHTRIFCECGHRYYHMLAGDIPLSKRIKIVSACPVQGGGCGKVNRADYEFDAVFPCRKWWRPWEKHFIANHFTKNEGNKDEDIFPRRCNCGAEILLHQRRLY